MTEKNIIPYVRVDEQGKEEIESLEQIFRNIVTSGKYVGGEAVDNLEAELAEYIGVKEVVTLNSGTDALMFSLVCAGVKRGDEVITAPNSFIASAASIAHIGAVPVFADVDDDQNICPGRIAEKVTSKTKAIMPIHLTGRPCQMDPIMDIADKAGAAVIEDAAQSIGTLYQGQKTGSIGHYGCFSAHPLKNLNAIGDGGYVATNNSSAAAEMRKLRNHGLVNRITSERWGFVSRMDALQAAILSYRLTRLEDVIQKRRHNAGRYHKLLNRDHVFMPEERPEQFNTYHTFVIQVERRDELQAHLAEQGIKTSIHYPKPIHLQPAAAYLGHQLGDFPKTEEQAQRILTLPVNQNMTDDELVRVADCVNAFYSTNGPN